MKRLLLAAAAVTSLPVLFLGGALLFLLLSTRGAQLLLDVAQRWLPMTYHDVSGSVYSGLRVGRLELALESAKFSVADASVRAQLSCLLARRICIDAVEIATFAIEVPENAPRDDAGPIDVGPEILPWGIRAEIAALDVAHAELRLGGRDPVVLTDFALALRFTPRQLHLSRLAASYAGASALAQARLQRAGDWQLSGSLDQAPALVPGELPLDVPSLVEFSARGDFDSLQASLSGSPEQAVSATLDWSGAAGPLRAEGRVDGLELWVPALAGNPWTQLQGPLSFAIQGEPGLRSIDLAQNLEGYAEAAQPLTVKLREDGSTWHLVDGRLGQRQNPLLQVAGVLGELSALEPDLRLQIAGFEPPPIAALPVEAVSGQTRLRLRLDDPLNSWSAQDVDLAISARGSEETESRSEPWLLSGSLSASETIYLPSGELAVRGEAISLSYARPPGTSSTAHLDFSEGLRSPSFTLEKLNAVLSPRHSERGGALRIQASARGDIEGSLDLSIDGLGAQELVFTAQPLDLLIHGQRLRSDDTIRGDWSAARRSIRLLPLCLEWRSNRACSDEASLAQSGQLRVALEILDEYRGSMADKPFSLQAAGEGEVLLRWSDAVLQDAAVDLDLPTLMVDPYANAGTSSPVSWDKATVSGRYSDGLARLQVDLQSRQFGPLAIAFAQRDRTLEGRVQAQSLQLGMLDDLLPSWSLSQGELNMDLRLEGTRDAPRVLGQVTLHDGKVFLPQYTLPIADIRLDLEALGESIAVDGSAMLGGGPLTLNGVCCEGDRATISLQGQGNRVQLPVGLDAVISPQLALTANARELTLTGRVNVDSGVFEHSGPGAGGVPLSNDIVRLDIPQDRPRRFGLRADLRTIIEPGFTVRSNEIESTVAGDLRLLKRSSAPAELYGNLQVLGGELRVFGQALRITRGAVGFTGDPLNPDLGLSAEREIRSERLRVGFRVAGTLDAPQLELFSDPVRSERDTLSYLLRGRGPDAGASVDGTAMALSLGASALNRSGVLESLNSIPGLSGVAIGAEGSDEDMAATISAYVGQRLYLSYGVGMYEPVNALTARLYLRSRLWLEVVSRLESSFDLFYRFDLD